MTIRYDNSYSDSEVNIIQTDINAIKNLCSKKYSNSYGSTTIVPNCEKQTINDAISNTTILIEKIQTVLNAITNIGEDFSKLDKALKDAIDFKDFNYKPNEQEKIDVYADENYESIDTNDLIQSATADNSVFDTVRNKYEKGGTK